MNSNRCVFAERPPLDACARWDRTLHPSAPRPANWPLSDPLLSSFEPEFAMSARFARLVTMVALTIIASAPLAAQHHAASRPQGQSIPEVARNAGLFSTLLAAVETAGLSETLLGRGPFTVFAPTDDAFSRLPHGTVESLLRPENRDRLRTILTYHVVAGRVSAAEARRLNSAETVSGQDIAIESRNGALRINDATVRIADIPASNGVVHVIDRVLLPRDVARARH
jgi:uncharacterized surface protein with fasciclin (FAS1) repeats